MRRYDPATPLSRARLKIPSPFVSFFSLSSDSASRFFKYHEKNNHRFSQSHIALIVVRNDLFDRILTIFADLRHPERLFIRYPNIERKAQVIAFLPDLVDRDSATD